MSTVLPTRRMVAGTPPGLLARWWNSRVPRARTLTAGLDTHLTIRPVANLVPGVTGTTVP
jgi:hypothetical protein